MSGTKLGGKKTAQTNKEKYGENYYKELGRKGGSVKHPETRWFNTHRDLASKLGKKGGHISKRGKSKNNFKLEVRCYPELAREIEIYNELERLSNEN